MDTITEQTFEELEKTSKNFWNIARETGNFLNMLIKSANAKEVLEIGTSNGYSGIWIAKALKETGGHLSTIEFWDNRQSLAIENFKKCGVNDLITPLLGSALDILSNDFDKKIDFAFIDANKGEYIKYFELIDPILKSGGIIAADNVLSHETKVKPFVDAIKNNPDYQVEILNLPAGLLLARKK
ncbi:MAG: O-methyltransferase [Candidatus Gastranaerophilales bacterium]|nr:O-methyltransferase [Candidatus Gastranaerophilales bacterium]